MRLKVLVLLGIVAVAPSAYAQNTPKTAVSTNTVSATLAVKATLAKAVQLTLNTGSGCTVSNGGGGDFSLDFGTVDALGVSTGCAGAGAGKFTSGGNQAIYYSDYTITPAFTNQGTTTGSTLSAYVSSAFGQAGFSIVQTNSAPSAFGDFAAMSTASGSQTDVKGGSSIASSTALTRYVGVKVDGANTNTASGSSSTAVVTYTLTIQ
jgi:hypothetical protein